MKIKILVKSAVLTLLFFFFYVAYSHDIWLHADQLQVAKGDTLILRQLAGSDLKVEMELPLLVDMTSRFELITADSSVDLLGEMPDRFEWREPILERIMDFEGLVLLRMDHHFIYTEFTHEKFLEYLEHEELKLEQYLDQLEDKPTQSERYARTFKCLVQIGESASGEQYKQITGQKLELLLLQNPYQLNTGDELDVQVLFDSQPLIGHLVTALTKNADEQQISKATATTDEQGIAHFTLEHPGFYLLRMIHLYPCDDPYTDWESFWATYSFELN